MDKMIAFCGLTCTECPAYIATQANDEAAKERLAAQWRVEFNAPDISIADVTCDGCLAFDGRLGGYCSNCPIRACGVEKGVVNCAYCSDYETCEKLAGFFGQAPAAKATLDAIRQSL